MLTSKNMNNQQIAETLRNVAAAHQLADPQKFKFQIIAYNRAADSVEHATSEIKDLWDDGKLDEVPGIGTSIAKHLDEIFRTGKSKHFEEISKGIDPKVFKLMELPGIGIKTAIKMVEEKRESEIKDKLKEVDKLRSKNQRHLLPYAENVAGEVVEWMEKLPETEKIEVLGSLRRRMATIGDIDILATPKKLNDKKANAKLINHFVSYPKKQKIIEQGDKTASILLPNNVQVDILVCSQDEYGSALQHFTGSKMHNIALREYAKKLGFSLSEYGARQIQNLKSKSQKYNSKIKKFDTEKKLYNFLKLDYIQPELREDTGEIEAAKNYNLPKLVKVQDVKGDLQIHSSFDIETSHDLGVSSMKDIVKKANELGYEYLAFTEHNPSRSKHNDKQIIDILKRKRDGVDKINEELEESARLQKLSPQRLRAGENVEEINYSISKQNKESVQYVFNSLEIDIAPDGKLPVPEEGLETLDFALVSIHSSFDLPRLVMTRRVIRALSHPKVKIFAHPTTRKLNEREGVELDWPEIMQFCLENKKFIEINASPSRLDLPDTLVRDAVKLGVRLSLGADSHEVSQMDNMRYGVDVARRGWCEKSDIINCLSLEDFKKVIE